MRSVCFGSVTGSCVASVFGTSAIASFFGADSCLDVVSCLSAGFFFGVVACCEEVGFFGVEAAGFLLPFRAKEAKAK